MSRPQESKKELIVHNCCGLTKTSKKKKKGKKSLEEDVLFPRDETVSLVEEEDKKEKGKKKKDKKTKSNSKGETLDEEKERLLMEENELLAALEEDNDLEENENSDSGDEEYLWWSIEGPNLYVACYYLLSSSEPLHVRLIEHLRSFMPFQKQAHTAGPEEALEGQHQTPKKDPQSPSKQHESQMPLADPQSDGLFEDFNEPSKTSSSSSETGNASDLWIRLQTQPVKVAPGAMGFVSRLSKSYRSHRAVYVFSLDPDVLSISLSPASLSNLVHTE